MSSRRNTSDIGDCPEYLAYVPKEVALPRQAERQVAKYLADRRDFPVVDVVAALRPLAQPDLLRTEEQDAELVSRRESNPEVETGAVVAPIAEIAE